MCIAKSLTFGNAGEDGEEDEDPKSDLDSPVKRHMVDCATKSTGPSQVIDSFTAIIHPDDVKFDEGVNRISLYGGMEETAWGEVPNNPPLHLMEGTGYFPVSSHPNVVQNVILGHELMVGSKHGPKKNQLREKEGCFGPALRVFDVMTHPRLDANSVMICDVRDSDKRLLCLKYVVGI
ncbi:hypothetical protein U1Q18_014705 [Sarracenia purpurea var. burkii]